MIYSSSGTSRETPVPTPTQIIIANSLMLSYVIQMHVGQNMEDTATNIGREMLVIGQHALLDKLLNILSEAWVRHFSRRTGTGYGPGTCTRGYAPGTYRIVPKSKKKKMWVRRLSYGSIRLRSARVRLGSAWEGWRREKMKRRVGSSPSSTTILWPPLCSTAPTIPAPRTPLPQGWISHHRRYPRPFSFFSLSLCFLFLSLFLLFPSLSLALCVHFLSFFPLDLWWVLAVQSYCLGHCNSGYVQVPINFKFYFFLGPQGVSDIPDGVVLFMEFWMLCPLLFYRDSCLWTKLLY